MFRIRMVTFDVTGTLLQIRRPIYETYAEAASRRGINADPRVLKKMYRNEYAKMRIEHPNFGRSTGLDWSQWWTSVVKGTFADYAKTRDDAEKIKETAKDLLDYFQTPDAWVVQSGAHQLLQFLKRSYFHVGIISNFDTRLHGILRGQDLDQYFDFVVTSYEAGYEKPNAKIFAEALRHGKRIASSEAVHIGNDVYLDYLAARSAGWNGMLILPKREGLNKLVQPGDVFASLAEVKNYFQFFSE